MKKQFKEKIENQPKKVKEAASEGQGLVQKVLDDVKGERPIKRPRSSFKQRVKSRISKDKMQVIARAGEFYRTADGDYMDILKINGTSGVARFSADDIKHLINDYKGGVKTLTRPFNFLILDFLVDHQAQIDYYRYKYDQLDSRGKDVTQHKFWLAREIANLEYRQEHKSTQQYFCVVFGETIEKLKEQRETMARVPRLNITPLSATYKDGLIKKINNLNSSISLEVDNEG